MVSQIPLWMKAIQAFICLIIMLVSKQDGVQFCLRVLLFDLSLSECERFNGDMWKDCAWHGH